MDGLIIFKIIKSENFLKLGNKKISRIFEFIGVNVIPAVTEEVVSSLI